MIARYVRPARLGVRRDEQLQKRVLFCGADVPFAKPLFDVGAGEVEHVELVVRVCEREQCFERREAERRRAGECVGQVGQSGTRVDEFSAARSVLHAHAVLGRALARPRRDGVQQRRDMLFCLVRRRRPERQQVREQQVEEALDFCRKRRCQTPRRAQRKESRTALRAVAEPFDLAEHPCQHLTLFCLVLG
jgi:hypothetical protein